MADILYVLSLALFLLSTPVACYAVFFNGQDRKWWAVWNSYAFSSGMLLLYFYPLLSSLKRHSVGFKNRLDTATMNWIVWLSVFTEVVFQIPHNLLVSQLHAMKGSMFEWPFASYGLSDSRWREYNNGSGLEFEVELINWNDGLLGIVVLVALVFYKTSSSSSSISNTNTNTNANKNNTTNNNNNDTSSSWLKNELKVLPLVLVTVFRDATLFRETVEYMYDHHRKGYPHTTSDPMYRHHAIACLWTVNIVWLIAPLLTLVWAYLTLKEKFETISQKKMK